MKEVNLEAIQEHVSVQYRDMTGVIQIDGIESITSIYDLFHDNGFPTDDKFIIGFGLGESSIQGVGEGALGCSILFVYKKDYGDNYDEVEARIRSNGALTLYQKRFYISYKDLGKYIKRFELLLTNELTKHVSAFEIVEMEDEE